MSSGVFCHTATHLSGISASTWIFKLRLCHSLTSAEGGWTLPIQNWLFIDKAAPPCLALGTCLSYTDTLLPQIHFHAVTHELADAMQAKRVSIDQITDFIFLLQIWKSKQMNLFFCYQIIYLKHPNLSPVFLVHCSNRDATQLYPLKWGHQKFTIWLLCIICKTSYS